MNTEHFSELTTLVTGAAGGMGRAMTLALAHRECDVAVLGGGVFRTLAVERNAAALIVAALLLPPFDVSGLTLLIVVDVVLFLMLVVEHVRLERVAAARTAAAEA